MEIVDVFVGYVYNNNDKPLKAPRILRVMPLKKKSWRPLQSCSVFVLFGLFSELN